MKTLQLVNTLVSYSKISVAHDALEQALTTMDDSAFGEHVEAVSSIVRSLADLLEVVGDVMPDPDAVVHLGSQLEREVQSTSEKENLEINALALRVVSVDGRYPGGREKFDAAGVRISTGARGDALLVRLDDDTQLDAWLEIAIDAPGQCVFRE